MKLKSSWPSSFALSLTLLVACQSKLDESGDGASQCTEGSNSPCICADGRPSLAACLPSGVGFAACQCGSSTSPITGAGSASGSPATGGFWGSGATTGGMASGGSAAIDPGGTAVVAAAGGKATTGSAGNGNPGPSATAGTTAGGAAAASGDLPCEVREIVAKSCATCHGSPPAFGAPFALLSAADFRAHGGAVLQRVADDVHPMPPEPYARLTAVERASLQSFIGAGAPASSCAGPATTPVTGAPDPVTTDPSVTCYKVTARDSKAAAKFTVPTTPDLYQCFQYALPWGTKKVQVVSAKPIVDNSNVLHHWILYNNSGQVTDGSSTGCLGAHPDATMITGWAPGGQAFQLPEDVGMRVEAGGLTLETHYNNKLGQGQTDASGAELCVTEKIRPNEAAVHWLGTQSLNKINATGTCTPANTGEVTILSTTPHMHLQGRHLKTVINRSGGGSEVLIDKPFDFNTQVSYPVRAVIKPGDTLTTTCTYATPTPFGEGTNQEMCYNFVVAYPAGGLAQALQLLRKNDCSGF